MILQHVMNLLLDLIWQVVHLSGPCIAATGACEHHDGQTSHDEHAAVVMALRTFDGERVVGIGHGPRVGGRS